MRPSAIQTHVYLVLCWLSLAAAVPISLPLDAPGIPTLSSNDSALIPDPSAYGFDSLVDADLARIRMLGERGLRRLNGDDDDLGSSSASSPTNQTHTNRRRGSPGASDVQSLGDETRLFVQVSVGSRQYKLLVDPGSGNTWVGNRRSNPYQRSTTSRPTGNTVQQTYGKGSYSGMQYVDSVSLSGLLTVQSQSVGAATTSRGFPDSMDGILGLAPKTTTRHTVSRTYEVPTVVDTLYAEGRIPWPVVGMLLTPYDPQQPGTRGQLTFGGYERENLSGMLSFAPLTTASPANQYWGVDQSISYGRGGTPIMRKKAGIIDMGTTLTYLPADAIQAYMRATGAVFDQRTKMLRITRQQYSQLQTLYLNVGSRTLELTPNAQIWPRVLNRQYGGDNQHLYLVLNDIRLAGDTHGIDYMMGYVWLQRFYTVYDTGNKGVWFGHNKYWDSQSN